MSALSRLRTALELVDVELADYGHLSFHAMLQLRRAVAAIGKEWEARSEALDIALAALNDASLHAAVRSVRNHLASTTTNKETP